MLDMGFIPQVKRIVRSTPRKENRQTLLFSATFSQDIMNLAQQWTFNPITVEIEPERVATENVDQRVYLLESRDRLTVLKRILATPDATSVIIFANRRDVVRKVHERLQKQGLDCGTCRVRLPKLKALKRWSGLSLASCVCGATDVAGEVFTSMASATWLIRPTRRPRRLRARIGERVERAKRVSLLVLPVRMMFYCLKSKRCWVSRRNAPGARVAAGRLIAMVHPCSLSIDW